MPVPTVFNYRDFLFTSSHYHIVTKTVKLELSHETHSVVTFLKRYPNHLVFPSVRCCSQRPIIKRCVYLTVVISIVIILKIFLFDTPYNRSSQRGIFLQSIIIMLSQFNLVIWTCRWIITSSGSYFKFIKSIGWLCV